MSKLWGPGHRIILNTATTTYIKKEYPKETAEQVNIWRTNGKRQDELLELFNTLEEFALKAIHFENNHQHPALNSVKATFIQVVEQNAVFLVFQRDVALGSSAYSAVLKLYNLWKNEVDRK